MRFALAPAVTRSGERFQQPVQARSGVPRSLVCRNREVRDEFGLGCGPACRPPACQRSLRAAESPACAWFTTSGIFDCLLKVGREGMADAVIGRPGDVSNRLRAP